MSTAERHLMASLMTAMDVVLTPPTKAQPGNFDRLVRDVAQECAERMSPDTTLSRALVAYIVHGMIDRLPECDVEFDIDVFNSPEVRDGLKAMTTGTVYDWDAAMPRALIRVAVDKLMTPVENRLIEIEEMGEWPR